MTILIIIVHLIVCFALIGIVLLQTGKGADMGAVFGGAGSQTLFGNTGATTFLGKATTVAAIVFMLTSLSLAYISKSGDKSVVSDIKPAAQQTQSNTVTVPVDAQSAGDASQKQTSGQAPASDTATEAKSAQQPAAEQAPESQ